MSYISLTSSATQIPKKNLKKGTSLVNCTKDRVETLKHTSMYWRQNPNIDNIIILDWSSKRPINEEISNEDKKITLIRVEGEKKWSLSRAFNLAFSFVETTHILKCDTDILFENNFLNKISLRENLFYAGDWRKAKNKNQMHLNGVVYANTTDIFKINGFDERINTYGWEDDDLYQRLISSKVKRKILDMKLLYHLPHSNSLRSTNIEQGLSPEASTERNRRETSKKNPWSLESETCRYKIVKTSPILTLKKLPDKSI